jgi:hypothetical protein
MLWFTDHVTQWVYLLVGITMFTFGAPANTVIVVPFRALSPTLVGRRRLSAAVEPVQVLAERFPRAEVDEDRLLRTPGPGHAQPASAHHW